MLLLDRSPNIYNNGRNLNNYSCPPRATISFRLNSVRSLNSWYSPWTPIFFLLNHQIRYVNSLPFNDSYIHTVHTVWLSSCSGSIRWCKIGCAGKGLNIFDRKCKVVSSVCLDPKFLKLKTCWKALLNKKWWCRKISIWTIKFRVPKYF